MNVNVSGVNIRGGRRGCAPQSYGLTSFVHLLTLSHWFLGRSSRSRLYLPGVELKACSRQRSRPGPTCGERAVSWGQRMRKETGLVRVEGVCKVALRKVCGVRCLKHLRRRFTKEVAPTDVRSAYFWNPGPGRSFLEGTWKLQLSPSLPFAPFVAFHQLL